MTIASAIQCTAFVGSGRISAGSLEEVALSVKAILDRDQITSYLVFDDATGHQIDLDLRGTEADVVERLANHPLVSRIAMKEPEPRGPGRPKLGVVAREVTLLPRHWAWLNLQPGGASVALRKLIDQARRTSGARDRERQAQEATYRIMSAMAGNEPGYEEAARALFAKDRARFKAEIATWPADVSAYVMTFAEPAFRTVLKEPSEGEPSEG
jgi:hypothetical protein